MSKNEDDYDDEFEDDEGGYSSFDEEETFSESLNASASI